MKVVVCTTPFQRIWELPLINPVPVTTSVMGTNSPETVEFGVKRVRPGAGLLIEKVCPPEVPPAGAGLKTVTEAVPAVAIFPAGTLAVSEVELTKVVVKSAPFQRTMDPATKFEPVAVSVNVEPPAVAEFGLMEVNTGTGFEEPVTVRTLEPSEVCPSGFVIVRFRRPSAAAPEAVTFTVTCVGSVKVTEFTVKPVPLNAAAMRFANPAPGSKKPVPDADVPVTTMFPVVPCSIVFGTSVVIAAGAGALICTHLTAQELVALAYSWKVQNVWSSEGSTTVIE